MGSCASVDSKQSKQYKKDMKKPPQDIQHFLPHSKSDLQILQFEGSLSNVKIEGDVKEAISMSFQISRNIFKTEFPLNFAKEKEKKSLKWNIREEKFKFAANQYEIRNQLLSIKVFNKNNEIIQNIKINLYKILTGPIINKFKITLKDNVHVYLFYELQIIQTLKMQIKVKKAKLSLKSQHRGQKFNFTLQCNLNDHGKNHIKIMTRPSPTKSFQITQQSISDQLKDNHEQPVIIGNQKTRSSLKQIEEQKIYLDWDCSQILPEISFKLTVNQINTSLFYFHCWKVSKKQQNQQKQVLHRFSNFKMTFYELIQLKTSISKSNLKKNFVRLNQTIWQNGKEAGKCQCQFQITIPEYLKQLTGLTRTENGIFDNMIENIQNFRQLQDSQLEDQMKSLNQKLSLIKIQMIQKTPNSYRKKQIIKRTVQLLSQISKKVSNVKSHQKILIKNPKETNKLFQKQYNILQLFSTILNFLSWQDKKLSVKCWQLVNILMKRPQLQLKNLAFTQKQISLLQSQINQINEAQNKAFGFQEKSTKNLLQKKIKIGIEFNKLMFDLLVQSLNQGISMIDENSDQFPQNELFKYESFIRMKIFRDFILKEISLPSDTNFNELQIQGNQWQNSNIQTKEKKNKQFSQLDWNQHFYAPLRISNELKQREQKMIEVLKQSIWIEEISQRDLIFFRFFRIVIQKNNLNSSKSKTSINHIFPGQKQLTNAFLNELKNRSFSNFSQSLIISSICLLQNQDLHQTILLILAQKTNYYDTPAVLKCLSIYRLQINHLTKESQNLPASFCYGVFIELVKKILECESQTCVTAILLIIYEVYEKLEPEFQTYLTLYFLGNKFCALFYHWSYVVRSIFQHFFVLRIAQNKSIFKPVSEVDKKLKHSYQKVISELKKNNKILLQKELCINLSYKVSEQYFSRMKQKMQKKTQHKKVYQSQNNSLETIKKSIFSQNSSQNLQIEIENIKEKQNQYLQSKWPSILNLKKKQQLLSQLQINQSSLSAKFKQKPEEILQEDDQIPSIPELRLQKKQYTYHQSAKYHNAFTQNQFSYQKINDFQKNFVSISHQQFDKVNLQITKNIIQTKQLPTLLTETYTFFEFGNLMVQTNLSPSQN